MSPNKEGASKRQVRKEELRRKERQQRLITIGIVAVVAVILVGVIIIPSINNVRNPGNDFAMITPEAYTTTNGTNVGNPQAKVKVEVFEDFQCSACKTYAEFIEPQVIQSLAETNQIHYVFYEFPFLDDKLQEKASDLSANAAECANAQGKFWDYKKLLFANQRLGFTEDRLVSYAKALGIDTDQFKTCLTEKPYQNKIDQDIAAGVEYGITGTPTIIVNGKDVSPGKVPTYEQILQAVQEAQAAAK
jgi:protein-disulfide isomerase